MNAPQQPSAELIFRSGEQAGKSWPLSTSVTTLGRANGCDLCLPGEGIDPVHCLIVLGEEGPSLRAWPGATVLVNGRTRDESPLRAGDRLEIGPHRFEFVLHPRPSVSIKPPSLHLVDANSDAPRAAELTEWEKSLHFHERDLDRRREHLLSLRRRFVKRWKSHWAARRKQIDQMASHTQSERRHLAEERVRFEKVRAEFHGKAEIEKRTLQEERQQLTQLRQEWAQKSKAVAEQLAERKKELDQRSEELKEAERQVEEKFRKVHSECARLRVEAEGLENRIRHGRDLLAEADSSLIDEAMPALPVEANETIAIPVGQLILDEASASARKELARQEEELCRFAEQLEEQRALLREQFANLDVARESLQEEQTELANEMETIAASLLEREKHLDERETLLRRANEQAESLRDGLVRQTDELRVRDANLNAIEIQQQGEHSRLQAEVTQRESRLQRRESALQEMCRRWSVRRREELEKLRAELAQCAEQRETWRKAQRLAEQQVVELTAAKYAFVQRAIALEQTTAEALESSEEQTAAHERIQQWNRKANAAITRGHQELETARAVAAGERDELENRFTQVREALMNLSRRELEWADRLAKFECDDYTDAQHTIDREAILEKHAAERTAYEQEIESLRAEIERLAALLIERPEESDDSAPPRLAA